ncbi:hypothetical protein H1C71_004914 [Ictidomys tridecemlineatus]|nr:hypothetical protein H1C71_004914 [Ictidomys tridecemlineatus]
MEVKGCWAVLTPLTTKSHDSYMPSFHQAPEYSLSFLKCSIYSFSTNICKTFINGPGTEYLESRKGLILWEELNNKFDLARERKLVMLKVLNSNIRGMGATKVFFLNKLLVMEWVYI